MSVTVAKRTTYQAMCEQCRSLSRWYNTPSEAIGILEGHRCEPVK